MTSPLLYSYQLQDVRKLERLNGRGICAYDTGLGKTVLTLSYLQRCPDVRPVVVVCPSVMKITWQREAEKHCGIRAELVEGMNPANAVVPLNPKMVIVNYDIVGPTRSGPGWLQWLQTLQPKMIVLDESHLIGNLTTTRTRNCRKLCRGVKQVLALTATPITNRPAELFPILNILWPWEFSSWSAYGHRYCGPKRVPWGSGWEFKGATNLAELHERLTGLGMIRRRTEDVFKEMPTKRRTVLPMQMRDDRQYRSMEKDFLAWIAKYKPERLTKALKAERLVRMNALKLLAATSKLPNALEWISNHMESSGEKMIAFGIHKEVIAKTHEKFKKTSVVVDGSVTGAKRQAVVDHFLKDKKCRLLIGNIRAAGVGWSGLGVPDTTFLEYPWKPADLLQCEGRTSGIKRGVKGIASSFYYTVAADSLEEWLLEINQSKHAIASAVIDGGSGGQRFNIYDQLMRRLLKERA